jgi:hypothetical protein
LKSKGIESVEEENDPVEKGNVASYSMYIYKNQRGMKDDMLSSGPLNLPV